MIPTDYVAHELVLWEQALREQREREKQLEAARRRGRWFRVIKLRFELQALRTTADLLLAHAVKVKCSIRDYRHCRRIEAGEIDTAGLSGDGRVS